MISKGVSYTEIEKRVKNAGYSISRGGISYIKKSHESEITEQNTKQKTEQTEQHSEKNIENNEEYNEEKSIKPFEKSKISNKFLLTDLEFKNLENAFNIVYSSNEKRLKNYRASGVLNALNTVKSTIEIIKKRGNFK